jgi:hypothetical protein
MSTTSPLRASSVLPDAVLHGIGAVLGVIGLLGYGRWALTGGLVRENTWLGVDFYTYYRTAQVLRQGGDIYHSGISPPYVYPPLLAALVTPLSLLLPTPATILWKILQHLCLLGAGALLVSLLPRRLRPLAAGLLLLGALTIPVQDEIQLGESNSLILLLVAGAIWLVAQQGLGSGGWGWEQGNRVPLVAAGLLLALATSIKVLPLLLIVYFWARGPRAVAAVATNGFLAIQVVLLLTIPATRDYWLVQFPGLFGQVFAFLDNQSLNAALARAFLPTDPGQPAMQLANGAVWRPVLTWLANGLAVLLTTGVLGWRIRRPPASADSEAAIPRLLLETGLVLLTIHLISGSTWLHHLIDLAVLVVAVLTVAGSGLDRRWAGLVFGGLALIFVLLLVRPADWVGAVVAVTPGGPFLAWLASNSGLWAVGVGWLLAVGLLVRTAD